LLNVDDDNAIAVVVAGRSENLVASTQHVLTHDLRRHIGVARLCQVAVRGAANEAALALRVEPAGGFAIGDDRRDWCAGRLFCCYSSFPSPSASAAAWSALLALSAASTLVARATSVVPVAVAWVSLLLVSVSGLAAATRSLWIVLSLRRVAGIARPVRWSRRIGI
jgi:hypothetical protein